MKVIVEYDRCADDEEAFNLMVQSRDMHLVVRDFMCDDELREEIKRKCKNNKVDGDDIMTIIIYHMCKIMDKLNVTLDILS